MSDDARTEREELILDLIDLRDNHRQTIPGSVRWNELNALIRRLKNNG